MPYLRISDVDKQRLSDTYNRNGIYIQLAQQLGIKTCFTTAYAIDRRAEENGGQEKDFVEDV